MYGNALNNCEAIVPYSRIKLNSLKILSPALVVFQEGFYYPHFKEENTIPQGIYIQSALVFMGSTPTDSTNCRFKIFKKIFQKVPKRKLEFTMASIYIAFTLY